MKKIGIKLGGFILISIFINTLFLPAYIANADVPDIAAMNIAFKTAEPCVDTTKAPDKDKIITIVEEPFGDTGGQGSEFEIRGCYRNTVIVITTIDNKKSSKNYGELNRNPIDFSIDDPNYGAVYSSKVYALISVGGTSMITGYISMIYKWAAGLVGLIAVLVIVISAIQISVSGGDSGTVTKAKDRIIKSISGIAVLFLSGLILYTINPNFFTLQ